jgi:hypothetical protein
MQAKIDVLKQLRNLEFEARCPYQTKAWRALADSVEAA